MKLDTTVTVRGAMNLLKCGFSRAKRLCATLTPDEHGKFSAVDVVGAMHAELSARTKPSNALKDRQTEKRVELLVRQIENCSLEAERRRLELERMRTAPVDRQISVGRVRELLDVYMARLHVSLRTIAYSWAPAVAAATDLPAAHRFAEVLLGTAVHHASEQVRQWEKENPTPAPDGIEPLSIWPDAMSVDATPSPIWTKPISRTAPSHDAGTVNAENKTTTTT
jgi:hypothetical protein